MIEIHTANSKTCIERVEGGVIITTETGFEKNSSPRRFVKERDFSPAMKNLLAQNPQDTVITAKGIAVDDIGNIVIREEEKESIYE